MIKVFFFTFLILPTLGYEYSQENPYENTLLENDRDSTKNKEESKGECSNDALKALNESSRHVGGKNIQENFETSKKTDIAQKEDSKNEDFCEETPLVSIEAVKIQILDKISGKIFKEILVLGQPKKFGTITITLKKAYQNNPEEDKEIYALVNIKECGKTIFQKWLFASSPAINLMKHAVYDVRIES